MVEVRYRGRLGNNLIQYAAGVILAKKAGLSLKTQPSRKYCNTGAYKTDSSLDLRITTEFGKTFNLQPVDGLCYIETIELTDSNYLEHLNDPQPNIGYTLNGFFQHKKLLCDYRDQILDLYNKPKSLVPSDDVFIACRLGDTLTSGRPYCTMKYLNDQLKNDRHKYNKAYITSDTINHPPLQKLIKKYDLIIYQAEPMDTIIFASQFNNLILSAGSFSYWMVYLSEADNITIYKTKSDPLQKQGAWQYNNNVKLI